MGNGHDVMHNTQTNYTKLIQWMHVCVTHKYGFFSGDIDIITQNYACHYFGFPSLVFRECHILCRRRSCITTRGKFSLANRVSLFAQVTPAQYTRRWQSYKKDRHLGYRKVTLRFDHIQSAPMNIYDTQSCICLDTYIIKMHILRNSHFPEFLVNKSVHFFLCARGIDCVQH